MEFTVFHWIFHYYFFKNYAPPKEVKLGLYDSDVDTLCIKIEAIALLMEIKSSKVYN